MVSSPKSMCGGLPKTSTATVRSLSDPASPARDFAHTYSRNCWQRLLPGSAGLARICCKWRRISSAGGDGSRATLTPILLVMDFDMETSAPWKAGSYDSAPSSGQTQGHQTHPPRRTHTPGSSAYPVWDHTEAAMPVDRRAQSQCIQPPIGNVTFAANFRSEQRRVGKEC